MPLPQLGHTLLTQPKLLEQAVYIPDLGARMHELPPPDVPFFVAGPGAEEIVERLNARGRRCEIRRVEQDLPDDSSPRPRWRLWQPDPWVQSVVGTGRALDVGCGSGRDAVALAASSWLVTAMDPLPDALERGRDLEARYGDGQPILWTQEMPSDQYDLVLLIRCGRPELLPPALERVAPGGCLLFVGRTDLFGGLDAFQPLRVEHGKEWTRAEFRPNAPAPPPNR